MANRSNQSQQDPIVFQALHEGLGFHTFKESLPYTTPVPSSASKIIPKNPPPITSCSQSADSSAPTPRAQIIPSAWMKASLLKRLSAYSIDTLLLVIPFGAICFANAFPWYVLVFCIQGGISIEEGIFKTSFGKHCMGLKIRASRSSMLIRAALFIPTFMSGFGILAMLFHPDHQGFHDLLSHTTLWEKKKETSL